MTDEDMHTERGIDKASQQVRQYGLPYSRPRNVNITFAENGYIVTEGNQTRVYPTAPLLLAYISEITQGGPGGEVKPVLPHLAGLVDDEAGDTTRPGA